MKPKITYAIQEYWNGEEDISYEFDTKKEALQELKLEKANEFHNVTYKLYKVTREEVK